MKHCCLQHILYSKKWQCHWYSNSLWGRQSGDQILVGPRLNSPVQTGPGDHPASYKISIRSFLGIQWAQCGVNLPPHLVLRLKEEYSYPSATPLCLHP